MPGPWVHLAGRLWEGIRTAPLEADEKVWVNDYLTEPEWDAFVGQPDIDQRHGHDAGRAAASRGADPSVVRAALLHDIGKRHAGLGLVGRTLASVAIRLRLPLWERARMYRDHGAIGSEELRAWGAEPLVVDFALNHHGTRPPGFAPSVWKTLVETDKPQKPARFR